LRKLRRTAERSGKRSSESEDKHQRTEVDGSLEATRDEGRVEVDHGSPAFDHFEIRDAPTVEKSVSRMVFRTKYRLFHAPNGNDAQSPEREKATRQQGGFFSRENSSNGGKAIRTFLAS
jgi:hypothetical protein